LCTQQSSQDGVFCTAINRSTEYTVVASLLCTQRTTFTYVSNPSQLAQADGGQGRRSIYKGSSVAVRYNRVYIFCNLYSMYKFFLFFIQGFINFFAEGKNTLNKTFYMRTNKTKIIFLPLYNILNEFESHLLVIFL
jgi:hypothetical protein